ncbi:MAG: hypothetical protein QF752_12700 [Planctomycetota bacterium]|jgi:hypothetical protein|nr:hypothetical protein [Planctomycetota bacterium]
MSPLPIAPKSLSSSKQHGPTLEYDRWFRRDIPEICSILYRGPIRWIERFQQVMIQPRNISCRVPSTPCFDRLPFDAGKKRLVGSFESAYGIRNVRASLSDLDTTPQISGKNSYGFFPFLLLPNLHRKDVRNS